jgi:hypothetical protein
LLYLFPKLGGGWEAVCLSTFCLFDPNLEGFSAYLYSLQHKGGE